jgi:hypothetical protein
MSRLAISGPQLRDAELRHAAELASRFGSVSPLPGTTYYSADFVRKPIHNQSKPANTNACQGSKILDAQQLGSSS